MTIIVLATQLKRQVAEIINLVYYQKKRWWYNGLENR